MGIYRFILSLLVIIFHLVGGVQPAGYSVVFGFYLISGYVITLVLNRSYSEKIGQFYLNRALRIFPVYIIILLISFILIKVHGNVFLIANNGLDSLQLLNSGIAHYNVADVLNEISLRFFTNKSFTDFAVILNGFPQIVPQAWALCPEIIFYILAPFIVKLYKFNKKMYYLLILITFVYPIYTYLNKLDFPTYRYRSVFGTFFVFMLGSLIYYLKDKIPKIKKANIFLFLLISIYLFTVTCINKYELKEGQIYFALFIQIFILIVSTQISFKERFNACDKFWGSLSYGMYLGHFLSAFILLIITEIIYKNNGTIIFGAYGSNTFGLAAVLLTTIISIILLFLVEKPIEKLRIKIKQKRLK